MLLADAVEIHRSESAVHDLDHRALDFRGRNTLEGALDQHPAHRAVERQHQEQREHAETRNHARHDPEHPPVHGAHRRRVPAAGLPAIALFPERQHHAASDAGRGELVSRTRHTRSSNSMPRLRAALGTSEWLVMPGAVFTSSSHERPARSRMKSTRPQPLQSTARNAASARLPNSCSTAPVAPGTHVLRVLRDVLRVVVVVLTRRHDTDRGQRVGSRGSRRCTRRPRSAARPASGLRSGPRAPRPRARSASLKQRLTPTLDPSQAGFTITGRPSLCAAATTSSPRSRLRYPGVGRPSDCHTCLVRILSMDNADPSTPEPV